MSDPTYTIEDFINELLVEHHYSHRTRYHKGELGHLALDAASHLGGFRCFGCDRDTDEMGEYYIVHKRLWKAYGVEGMLCIGCFEKRLGRRLTPADFTKCAVNTSDKYGHRSTRLRDRLGIH